MEGDARQPTGLLAEGCCTPPGGFMLVVANPPYIPSAGLPPSAAALLGFGNGGFLGDDVTAGIVEALPGARGAAAASFPHAHRICGQNLKSAAADVPTGLLAPAGVGLVVANLVNVSCGLSDRVEAWWARGAGAAGAPGGTRGTDDMCDASLALVHGAEWRPDEYAALIMGGAAAARAEAAGHAPGGALDSSAAAAAARYADALRVAGVQGVANGFIVAQRRACELRSGAVARCRVLAEHPLLWAAIMVCGGEEDAESSCSMVRAESWL